MLKKIGFINYRTVLVSGIIAVILLFYLIFDPMTSQIMPKCLFHRLTGLQCMGCGSQRMLHALLNGKFVEAFHANALFFCASPILVFLAWLEIKRLRYPKLYAAVFNSMMIYITGAILAGWLLVRNLIGI